jgi:hypothetical protein
MSQIHVDAAFVRRIDVTEFAYSKDRMAAVGDVFGDAGLVSFVESNHLLALMAPTIPNPYFNRILIFSPPEAEHLSSILDAFNAKSAEAMIDISPSALSAAVSQVLSSRGFAQTDFHPIFARRIANWTFTSLPLKTRVVSTQDDLKVFQELYVQGWEASPGFADTMKKFIEKWIYYPGWRLFLALDGNEPISTAVLFVHDGVAYLADAATPAAFRGRGGQTSLLAARVEQARELGCDMIFSRADFGSISHKNMEKAGLPMAYTRAVWKCTAK